MSIWDKLAVSKPLDRVAGTVTSQSAGMAPAGPKPAEHHARWASPPATKPAAPGQHDLTGRTFGWFVVVGYLGKPNPKIGGKWLVRCRCGYFEQRTARAITNPANSADGCRECLHHEKLKARDRARPVRPVTFAGTSRKAKP